MRPIVFPKECYADPFPFVPDPPTRDVWAAKDDGQPSGLKVGTARQNRDGSMTLNLYAVPISGKLYVSK